MHVSKPKANNLKIYQDVFAINVMTFKAYVSVALCIRRTLCRHVTIGTPMIIFAVSLFLTIGTLLVQSW